MHGIGNAVLSSLLDNSKKIPVLEANSLIMLREMHILLHCLLRKPNIKLGEGVDLKHIWKSPNGIRTQIADMHQITHSSGINRYALAKSMLLAVINSRATDTVYLKELENSTGVLTAMGGIICQFSIVNKIPFAREQSEDLKTVHKNIPREKPFLPSGETSTLPGCRSPCRKPWTNIISDKASAKAFPTYSIKDGKLERLQQARTLRE
nr:hypothetical protein Iba_chr11dCG0300 [Ipomoea batatas]